MLAFHCPPEWMDDRRLLEKALGCPLTRVEWSEDGQSLRWSCDEARVVLRLEPGAWLNLHVEADGPTDPLYLEAVEEVLFHGGAEPVWPDHA